MAPVVANITPKPPAIHVGTDIAPLVPSNFAEVMQIADVLARSEMVPAAYKGKPANCVVAMMFGMEIGLPPLASLQHVAVVNGRPTLYGDGQLAVAMGKGQLEDIEESIEGEGQNMRAVCRVRRRGVATETLRTYSVADASKAGLWGKAGPWTQHPKRMLQMRARSFALRDTFADHLLGLSAEEARDAGIGPDNARDITPPAERPQPAARLDALEEIIGPNDAAVAETEAVMAGEVEPLAIEPRIWPAPSASAEIWQDFAKLMLSDALRSTSEAALLEWQQANHEGLAAIKDRSAKLHDWLGNKLAEHAAALAG